ncbi:MAG: hypothetical protein ACOYYS_17335 [Chloroflexota bacterium]
MNAQLTVRFLFVLVTAVLVASCSSGSAPQATPSTAPSATPQPTQTTSPTALPTHTPTVEPTATTEPTATSSTAGEISPNLVLWRLSSNLSMLAVGRAEGVSEDVVERMSANNQIMADYLGIELPPLFESSGDKVNDSAAAIHYLLDEAGPVLQAYAEKNLGEAEGQQVALAVKSMLATLLYLPPAEGKDTSLNDSLYTGIEKAATNAGLPEELYQPVLDAMAAGLPYEDVKNSIFAMHKAVAEYLGLEAAED